MKLHLQDIKSPNAPVFLWRGIGVFTSFGLAICNYGRTGRYQVPEELRLS